jgi:hypothetical protein
MGITARAARNVVEDVMVAMFEPRLAVDDRHDLSILPSNWRWTPTPTRPSRAVEQPDPQPGVYTTGELVMGHRYLVARVQARCRGPQRERLLDEAWAQYVLGPREPGVPWQTVVLRAYWRGETAALRSPEILAREDACKK